MDIGFTGFKPANLSRFAGLDSRLAGFKPVDPKPEPVNINLEGKFAGLDSRFAGLKPVNPKPEPANL